MDKRDWEQAAKATAIAKALDDLDDDAGDLFDNIAWPPKLLPKDEHGFIDFEGGAEP